MARRSVFVAVALLGVFAACRSAPVADGRDALNGVNGGDQLPRLAQVFYERMARRRLNSIATYSDPGLREFFRSQEAFSDYYASVASQLRTAQMRHTTPLRVEIDEFRFEHAGAALVDVRIVGKHQRGLRFWEIELERTDTWILERGSWVLRPDKL